MSSASGTAGAPRTGKCGPACSTSFARSAGTAGKAVPRFRGKKSWSRPENGTIMLPRVLEPEAMDSTLEAHDYDTMDHSAVNRVFVADFLSIWPGQGPILDVGTGTAQIPIELCRAVPWARVVGVDLSAAMLAVGRENARRAGLSDRLRLERCDAKSLPFAEG